MSAPATILGVPVIHVLDFSDHQPPPYDFAAMKAAGIAGVIIKLTEGLSYLNPDFAQAWAGAAAAGLWRAAYHFCHPELGSPLAEAAFYLAHLPPSETYDGMAADIEIGSGNQSAYALAFCMALEQLRGFGPLIYSDPAYITASLQDARLARYALWLAAQTLPPEMSPWPYVALWQYSWSAHVPGISGPVDESELARDLDGLRSLGKPPGYGLIGQQCALKPTPSHTSPALGTLLPGTSVRTISPSQRTDDIWRQILLPTTSGYVPARYIVN
ncbi:MAG: glycoside hydrolase family 25 protein [Patescibacteria group bacterium]|nr:glycoside hydrolase family 25 protein [Patescibacteria group bacterium]